MNFGSSITVYMVIILVPVAMVMKIVPAIRVSNAYEHVPSVHPSRRKLTTNLFENG